MSKTEHNRELATGWIVAWIDMDLDWLHDHLSLDFVHTSPFGQLAGRDHYLETVVPLAQKSVQKLVIKRVLAEQDQAVIWFENHTTNGVIDSCDWLFIKGDQIAAIQSFYDSSSVRQVLDDEEQNKLSDD